jgi:hypothetical protein
MTDEGRRLLELRSERAWPGSKLGTVIVNPVLDR